MTLEDFQGLPECVRGKGIYFLWLDDELLYIGASTQAVDRVNRQEQIRDFGAQYCETRYRHLPQIPFNKATIYKWDGRIIDMADAEIALIRRFKPPYNKVAERGEVRWGSHIDAEDRRK